METATPKQSAPIPRQSLSAAVVERLTEKILSGELREGEQLRQDAIAAEFQTSRIPVREALSHLAAEHKKAHGRFPWAFLLDMLCQGRDPTRISNHRVTENTEKRNSKGK